MRKLKHTPGPWKARKSGNHNTMSVDAKYKENNIEICEVWGQVTDTTITAMSRANARLIAAAPDMLEDMIWFVKRCRAGEVQSVKTQARFIERIESATGLTIEEVLS